MSTRMEAVRNRQVADVLDACADEQDKLQAAKSAYAEDPSEKNLAAMLQAEHEMHMFRRWLRQGGQPDVPEGSVVVGQAGAQGADEGDAQALPPARPKARLRRGA